MKQIYTLEVRLIGGPVTEDFTRNNPVVSRTIEARGSQTLERLHEAIFDAFDRFDPHMYEFQVGGRRPMDPRARKYVLPEALEDWFAGERPAGSVDDVTIGSLGLKAGDTLHYWFDFGDDWWHEVRVVSVGEPVPRRRYPRLVARVGDSPPQYPEWDEAGA